LELRPKSRTRKPARSMKKTASKNAPFDPAFLPHLADLIDYGEITVLRCHRRRRTRLPRHARPPRRRDPRPVADTARPGRRSRLRRGHLHRRSQRPQKKVTHYPVTQVVSTNKHRGHNHSSSDSQDGQRSTLTGQRFRAHAHYRREICRARKTAHAVIWPYNAQPWLQPGLSFLGDYGTPLL